MKIQLCPNCQTQNYFSASICQNCGKTLSINTVVDLDDELVDPIIKDQVTNSAGSSRSEPGSNSKREEFRDFQPEAPYSPGQNQSQPAFRERPGCLTAYSALAISSGILYGLSILIAFISYPLARSTVLLCTSSLISALVLAMGYGIWQMKKWAWWLVIIVQSINVIISLYSLSQSLYGIVSIVLAGIILYWFITNRNLFEDDYLSVEPASKGDWFIVLGALAIPLLVFVIIVVLVLLGPAIGNVFSNILNSLEP